MDQRYDRSIKLHCSTCGGTDFRHDDEGPIRCATCEREFTRDELIHENSATIQAEVDEVHQEIVDDLRKDLKASLRKSFAASKYIKIK